MPEAPPIPFTNTFAALPDRFFTRQSPAPVPDPQLITVNTALAKSLNINPDWLKSPEALQVFAGNQTPANAAPLAQVYAGHQFGGWNPQLGDGRAILLGDLVDNAGTRRDIQLKGSGRTPYSRCGDGRAWLGPVLREYLVSEAMHALGIPTTRALAAVSTGQQVMRETALPGAILTRVAASHIRVGTFQYFAARQDTEALQTLTDYVIQRHYPEAETPLDLLNAVIARQAKLIAQWMSVGFIHGVMNTDNMAISGETIDYGPCAFMDAYHPETVYSSIDQFSRYAYNKQPEIAPWNLAQFASCLLPLMGDEKPAVEAATAAIHRFPDLYANEWHAIFRQKIGLTRDIEGDQKLIEDFLAGLAKARADFTNSFRDLINRQAPDGLQDWKTAWLARLTQETGNINATLTAANPAYIPRNHRIEAMIQSAVSGDLAPFHKLQEILAHPFADQPENTAYRAPPNPDEEVKATFCGT